MSTRLSRYGQGHCREFAASEASTGGSLLQTTAGAIMRKLSVTVEMNDVDRVVPPWPGPLPRVRTVQVAVSSRQPPAQP